MSRFTVLDNFHSDEFECDYVAGLSYEAREGDDKLLALIPKWIEEGKIREGGPESSMTGTAEVSDAETEADEEEKAPPKKTKK
jgi:hypothetical protein